MAANVITDADLSAWLKLGGQVSADDAPILVTAAAAATSYVEALPHVAGAATWDDATRLGALMLAARLYRRRNSPSGIEAFGEAGVAYAARQDPDVARLLRLLAPRVG